MKLTFKICLLMLFCWQIFGNNTVLCQSSKKNKEIIRQILKANKSALDTVNQLVVVFNKAPKDTTGNLVMLKKVKKRWFIKSKPILAGVGRNGFANPNEKTEGDGKSPSGLFRLGQLFCYEKNVKTKLSFIQTTADDKWIDDPESDDYNRYVRGKTSAKSFEKLRLRSDAYKYCLVIEYNTHPIVKRKGSAIFLHVGKGASSGCIVLDEKKMKKILKWLSPNKNRCILMGNKDILMQGW